MILLPKSVMFDPATTISARCFVPDKDERLTDALYDNEPEKLFSIISACSRIVSSFDGFAENFFSCLKCELIYLNHYVTRAQAQSSIFAYIETFYNAVRPHSALGWRSPNAFAASLNSSVAA